MSRASERAYLRQQQRAELIARERQRIKDRVRFMRKHADGFSAADGYDLRRVTQIRAAKLGRLTRYFEHTYPSSQKVAVVVRPRTKAARELLSEHTQQKPLKGVKDYWIETPEPQATHVRIKKKRVRIKERGKRERVIERPELEIERAGVTQRFFRFAKRRKTIPAIINEMERLVATLPDGFYYLFTGEHELIEEGASREMLPDLLRRYARQYDKDFIKSVVGVRFIGSDVEGAQGYLRQMQDAREARRIQMVKGQQERRKAIRRQRRALLRGIKK